MAGVFPRLPGFFPMRLPSAVLYHHNTNHLNTTNDNPTNSLPHLTLVAVRGDEVAGLVRTASDGDFPILDTRTVTHPEIICIRQFRAKQSL